MRGAIRIPSFALVASTLLLAGCGWFGETAEEPVAEDDPAVSGALADPITLDPDLASQNRADSAAFVPSGDGAVPTVDNGAEAIAAARADALRLVGGPSGIQTAPEPQEVAGELPAGATLTAAARAANVPGGTRGCDKQVQYTMLWAARL